MTVLDMIGRGNGLQEVLDYLMCFAEAQIDCPVHAAALLLNRDNLAFRLAAAPSLPGSFAEAIGQDGLYFEINALDSCSSSNSLKAAKNIGAHPALGSLRIVSLAHHLRSAWFKPLHAASGKLLGMLLFYLDEHRYRQPSAADIAVMEFVARASAIAVEYAQQESHARIRAHQQETVASLGWHALTNAGLDTLMHRAAQTVADVLEVPLCKILELQPDRQAFSFKAGVGWRSDLAHVLHVAAGDQSQAGYTLQQKAPVVVADLRSETRFTDHACLDAHQVVSGLSVIIAGEDGEAYGVLSAHTPVRRLFTANDIVFMQSVANVLAAALGRHRIEEALRRSRKHITDQHAHLNTVYDTAPIGLCFIDIDLKFEWLNRYFASLVGLPMADLKGATFKDVLPQVADQIESCCCQVLATGEPVLDQEFSGTVLHDQDRHWVWLCSFYPILTGDEGLLGINMVFQDVTERKRADEERAQLAEIVATSYDAIIGITPHGEITTWNNGAEKLYHYSAAEVIGRSIEIIIPPERMEEYHRVRDALQRGERISMFETERLRKDGRRVYVSFTISPIRDSGGKVVAVSTIERDITKHRRREEETRRRDQEMRFILTSAKVGTWDWDMTTNAVKWSDNLEALHGRRPGAFAGTFDSMLQDVHPADVDIILTTVRAAIAGERDYHVEYRIVAADGETRWVEGKGQVFTDVHGEPYRMAGICTDITERKQVEQALRVNEERMRHQAARLAAADKQKDNFIAMLSHELRNPLAPISNVVQVLKLKQDSLDPQLVRWGMDIIDRQVKQLARLVDDLLDVARITQGIIQLQRERVDLREVVSQAIETAEPLIRAGGHQLHVDMQGQPLDLLIDAARITQVIANLLNNAAKYSGEGKNIWLTVQQDDTAAVLTVRDDGAGIGADILPHIFDLFIQADHSLDRSQGGLGLGLTLVKRLVEMHGGTVSAHSDGFDKGAEFTLLLPLPETVQEARPKYSTDMVPLHDKAGQRVLVVDDNVDSADAFAELLRMRHCEVEVCYDGHAAIAAAELRRPHVVFLDIGLPGMNGYDVAEILRKKYRNDILIVAVTGYGPTTVGTRSNSFDHYILKPIDADVLHAFT